MSASGAAGAGRPSPPPEVFRYSDAELRSGGAPGCRFDEALLRLWDARMEAGAFRYALRSPLPTRRLPGPLGLLVQLNPERAALRRPAQHAQRLDQPFQPELFNFTRVPPTEILLEMRRSEPPESPGDLVLINASPLERGHVLLVPAPGLRLPQALTERAARLGLDALLLSSRRGLRVGFNSLCALASVNHLHLHAYYLERALLAEWAPAAAVEEGGPLHALGPPSHPARGFLLYEDEASADAAARLARRLHAVASRLALRGYAHNVFVCRGAPPCGGVAAPTSGGVRALVWPREPCLGAKELAPRAEEDGGGGGGGARFNVALCELAGHVPLASRRLFETITEAQAAGVIGGHSLAEQPFRALARELAALVREDAAGTGDDRCGTCGASGGESAACEP
ncbi:GDP-D-glucose phosphorylase 1 [Petromyzon marinus]|uniref:GDP-D-glucose phosphorylase 1 n=1 Tax=Petromyzon marinus TaxID=7757 RepID=UPI003F71385B